MTREATHKGIDDRARATDWVVEGGAGCVEVAEGEGDGRAEGAATVEAGESEGEVIEPGADERWPVCATQTGSVY